MHRLKVARGILISSVAAILLLGSFASAVDRVVVVPIGGAMGDAEEIDVLEGKTFSNGTAVGLTGSMVDNGAVSLNPGTEARSIPQGYHDGNGTCEGDSDLIPENIIEGVSIFGVVGASLPDYTDNTDGTITKNRKPMWQKAGSGGIVTWYEAAAYCSTANDGGYDDWRMPSKEELKTLVFCSNGTPTPLADQINCGDMGTFASPTIDAQFTCESDTYWTSSVSIEGPGQAWVVSFATGNAHSTSLTFNFYVRCVR